MLDAAESRDQHISALATSLSNYEDFVSNISDKLHLEKSETDNAMREYEALLNKL